MSKTKADAPMNFAAYAAVDPSDIPEAKIMPMGSYIWKIVKQPTMAPSSTQTSTLIKLICRCMGPIEDFEDPDALTDFGPVNNEVRVLQFIYPEKQRDDEEEAGLKKRQDAEMRRVLKFLSHDLQLGTGPVMELLAQSVNATFIGTIIHEVDNRDPSGETFQDRLRQTAPVL